MKKILILMVGLLLIGVNVFAQGDLIVGGLTDLGQTQMIVTGTGSIGSILALNPTRDDATDVFMNSILLQSYDDSVDARMNAMNLNARSNGNLGAGASSQLRGIVLSAQLRGEGIGSVSVFEAANYNVILRGTGNYSNIQDIIGTNVALNVRNAHTYTANNYYAFRSIGNNISIQPTAFNVSGKMVHYYAEAFPDWNGTQAITAGVWIDQQTQGTNKYGIVLNGDGAGSDLVFGPNQEARIYSSAGRLYAQDSFGNQTILSPHDPDTGEWIYYSRNVKTGKVVRVDMERLVKAVEKITGEQFMIETITE